MEDTCIKVISEEHGKKVIAYYKLLGVDTEDWEGNSIGSYYGLFKGKFDYFTEPYDSKVIELPTYNFTKEELENLLHKCWIQSTRKQLEPLTEFSFRTFIEKNL